MLDNSEEWMNAWLGKYHSPLGFLEKQDPESKKFSE